MISSTAQMGKLRPTKRQDLPKAIWKSPGSVCCPSGCLTYPPCWVAHLLAHFPTPVLALCWRLLLVWGHIWKGHRILAWGSLKSIIPHPPGGFEGAVLRCGRQGQWATICGYHGSLGGTRGERGGWEGGWGSQEASWCMGASAMWFYVSKQTPFISSESLRAV